MLRIVLRIARVRQIAPLCTAAHITRASTTHQSSSCFTVHSNHKIGHSNCIKQYIHVSSLLGNEFVVLKTPSFAESISEGDVRWDKGVGDTVDVDEVVAEIETDKTSIPVPSSVSGVIEELLVADGNTVTAGTDLCKIRITDKVDAPPVSTKDPPSSSVDTTAAEPIRKEETKQPEETPSVVSGPPPTSIPPIPPVPTQPMSHGPATPAPLIGMPPAVAVSSRGERKVKMNRMRQRIAERLKDAQNTNAMLTTFNEIDMSRVIDMRNRHKEAFLKKHGIKLGFMSPFVKAACYALQDQPVVNAVIDSNEIIYRDYIDISCAVATPKGLVVPILRDVQNMSFADVEKELNILAAKAREGTLAIEDMEGGTFTISNGGVYGSMFGTPIINPPQSAILGMHATKDRPVAIDGKVEIRPMMYVALTYDHRLIDGREAVTFLKKIKSAVEDPTVLLTNI